VETQLKELADENAELRYRVRELQEMLPERENELTNKINKQLARLNSESANGYSFANSSTPTGAGYSPDIPPGRCVLSVRTLLEYSRCQSVRRGVEFAFSALLCQV
jgi:hypothetical protein